MRVLIIENEIYLAQSIANKLESFGYTCVIEPSIQDAQNARVEDFDVILLASSACGDNYENFISNHKKSIIIMLVSYISDDTITKPMRAGASDYIQKPFMIDELVRKISHYKDYKEVLERLDFYDSYFRFVELELKTPTLMQYTPPFVIKSNSQRSADVYLMKYARDRQMHVRFLSVRQKEYRNVFKQPVDKKNCYYLTHLELLSTSEIKELLGHLQKQNIIFSFVSRDDLNFAQVIDLTHITSHQDLGGEILSIKEYEKMIITKFESKYPDIELAKRLGISRKSLWEKRKKYEITRKK